MEDQKIGEPSILSRGWNLGKRIMIAGAAITFAPVVLPPLMIFSAVGLAFAVPFGALFAGYACTDKIMSSLLPPPQFLHNVGEGTEDEEGLIDEEENGKEMETVDFGEEPSSLRNSDEERVSDGADEESEVAPPVVAHEDFLEIEELKDREEDAKEMETADSEKEPSVQMSDYASAADEERTFEDVDVESTVLLLAIAHEFAFEELKDRDEDEKEMETADSRKEPSVQMSNYALVADERTSEDVDVESTMSPPAIAHEELYDEQKIWEQVEALRRIVGYGDALQTSYVEELKALYIFTGVEPPTSFKDPSSLVEVNDKLRFLKSVIGVK
ncbi:hypothetical protein QJS04_geneDACA006264 [Acorus gramineus]|uniref:Uncharacterized protein n=1 Tax=Acorus gramineus TaxID=55184 RepID=A0AAV9AY58_ACOGR|nr:hypothetical protein QJS04_geneDACA006264 [Acorus gramineus]